MPNEMNKAAKSETVLPPQRSVRQLMESVTELLRQENPPAGQLDESLSELAASLDRRLTAPEAVAAHEDAIQRAPWLTTEGERLKHQQTALRQSLQAIVVCSRGNGGSRESTRQLSQRMTDLAELYIEYDAAEQDFFQAAFPAPDWATQSRSVEA